jgi:hypothetical protein
VGAKQKQKRVGSMRPLWALIPTAHPRKEKERRMRSFSFFVFIPIKVEFEQIVWYNYTKYIDLV